MSFRIGARDFPRRFASWVTVSSVLLARATQVGVARLGLEVRVSNFAAQALYRAHGFRVSGLRKSYYRDTGEDALMMEWRPA